MDHDYPLFALRFRVKDWKKEYMNHHILDGGGWSLRVRFRNINRAVSGVNENPEEFVNAAGEFVAPMEVLEEAINELSSGLFNKVWEDKKWW